LASIALVARTTSAPFSPLSPLFTGFLCGGIGWFVGLFRWWIRRTVNRAGDGALLFGFGGIQLLLLLQLVRAQRTVSGLGGGRVYLGDNARRVRLGGFTLRPPGKRRVGVELAAFVKTPNLFAEFRTDQAAVESSQKTGQVLDVSQEDSLAVSVVRRICGLW
jgi:hypothetical protein